MPSPIGHALAGVAAGWVVAPPAGKRGAIVRRAAVFGLVAASPDVDLLAGAHSGPTHGLGAAVIVGAAAWLFLRSSGSAHAVRVALAITAAYASHTLLDWLGTDTSPPIGIMALWPFSRDYYESPLHVFMAISRRYWLREFWISNLRALARELVILLPIVAIVIRYRRGSRSR
jgi:inner membrane protein